MCVLFPTIFVLSSQMIHGESSCSFTQPCLSLSHNFMQLQIMCKWMVQTSKSERCWECVCKCTTYVQEQCWKHFQKPEYSHQTEWRSCCSETVQSGSKQGWLWSTRVPSDAVDFKWESLHEWPPRNSIQDTRLYCLRPKLFFVLEYVQKET